MKLDPVIVLDDGTILEYVNPLDCGVYLIFRVPWSKANKVLSKYGIRIEKKL